MDQPSRKRAATVKKTTSRNQSKDMVPDDFDSPIRSNSMILKAKHHTLSVGKQWSNQAHKFAENVSLELQGKRPSDPVLSNTDGDKSPDVKRKESINQRSQSIYKAQEFIQNAEEQNFSDNDDEDEEEEEEKK